MNSRSKLLGELKQQAVKLRFNGYSFSEIQSELGYISKGTLNHWLKNIELTEDQKKRILNKTKQDVKQASKVVLGQIMSND